MLAFAINVVLNKGDSDDEQMMVVVTVYIQLESGTALLRNLNASNQYY